MARVNPPPIKVPQSIATDLSPEGFRYLNDLTFVVFQLWERTGGGNDAVDNITSSESFETSLSSEQTQEQIADLEQIEDLIPIVDLKTFKVLEKNLNYTAVDGDFIEATSRAEITLDPNSEENDDIIVANGDSTLIKVLGRVKVGGKIETTINIRRAGTSLHFKKFKDYWRII